MYNTTPRRRVYHFPPNAGKPAVPLLDALQATQANERLIVQAATQNDAHRAMSIIDEPWRSQTDEGVILFNTPTPVRIGDLGLFVVQPADEQPLDWHLRTDRVLELLDGTTVVASGNPTSSVSEIQYDLPRVGPDLPADPDPEFVVRSPDGTALNEYTDASAVLDDWQPVWIPLVPSRLAFDDVDVAFYDADDTLQFRVLDHDVSLATVAKRFRDTYTVTQLGKALPVDELIDRFQTWYAARTIDEEVSASLAAQALIQSDDTVVRCVFDGERTRVLTDQAWIIPPGLQSPDRPENPSNHHSNHDN